MRTHPFDTCNRKRILGGTLGLSLSLALTACGGGGSEEPVPTSRITAQNMVEVAALSEFENRQSAYVGPLLAIQKEFSNGVNGSGKKNCSVSGSVSFSQNNDEITLQPQACKHRIESRDLELSSGIYAWKGSQQVGKPIAVASFDHWKGSYNFLSEGGYVGADAPLLNGMSTVRAAADGAYERTANYSLSRGSQSIDVSMVYRVDQKFTVQGDTEQMLVVTQSTVANSSFAQALKISRTAVVSRPIGAGADKESYLELPARVTSVDGAELTITRDGELLQLSLRSKEGGVTTKTVQKPELEAALKKLL